MVSRMTLASMIERADADAEVRRPIEGHEGVVPKESEENDREIEEIAMNVLQDEGKRRLAAILRCARFRRPRRPADPEKTRGSRLCGSSSR